MKKTMKKKRMMKKKKKKKKKKNAEGVDDEWIEREGNDGNQSFMSMYVTDANNVQKKTHLFASFLIDSFHLYVSFLSEKKQPPSFYGAFILYAILIPCFLPRFLYSRCRLDLEIRGNS